MPIYTSYIAFWKKYQNKMPDPHLITASRPEWWTGLWRPDLAPDLKNVQLFKDKRISFSIFEQRYLDKLDKIGIKDIVNSLPVDCTLLCWESKGKPCHRHLLASYLTAFGNLGYTVKEFSISALCPNNMGVSLWHKPLLP